MPSLAAIILAPAVPRKVMVLLDGLLSSIANVTIEHGCIFYNLACCEMLFKRVKLLILINNYFIVCLYGLYYYSIVYLYLRKRINLRIEFHTASFNNDAKVSL